MSDDDHLFEVTSAMVGKMVSHNGADYLLLGITSAPGSGCRATLLNYDEKVPCSDLELVSPITKPAPADDK